MLVLLGLLSFAATSLLAPADAMAGDGGSDYRLGTQDKVRIKVFEWRPTRDEIFEWEALNDVFTVSVSGKLSLPLIGDVPAAGIDAGELAKTIEHQLKTRLGLIESPAISAEVVQFRPFYIVGQVERPGEYPYRPGLSILQALSIAGGLQRPSELGFSKLISGMGELQLLSHDNYSMLARQARLETELKGAQTIQFPPAVMERKNVPSIALLMQQEQLIFESRREAVRTQVAALEELKNFLQKEIVSLTAQVEAEDKRVSLLEQELKGISSLTSKGLATASRQLGLERVMAQMEGDRLRVQSNLMRARQDISKADINILELRHKRMNEAALELRQTQASIEQIAHKSETAERLLSEAQGFARLRSVQPSYAIVRQSGGQTLELSALETTPVEPGDTVKVIVPLLLGTLPGAVTLSTQPTPPPQPSAGEQRTAAEQAVTTKR